MSTQIDYRPPRRAAHVHVGETSNDLRLAQWSDDCAIHMAAVGLRKNYRKGAVEIPVLKGVDLDVRCGEFLAIVGQSGSGKSTLLHLLATLDAPTAGEIYFLDHRIDHLAAAHRDRL